MEDLLRALRAAAATKQRADRVPDDVEEVAHELWEEARVRAASQKEQSRAPAVLLTEQTDVAALNPGVSQLTIDTLNWIARSTPSSPIPAPRVPTPLRRFPLRPADIATVNALVARLNDVVMYAGFDISAVARRSRRFPGGGQLTAQEVRDVLTVRKFPTAEIVRQIVAACGGTRAEQDEWEIAAQRVLTEAAATPPAADKASPTTGSLSSSLLAGRHPPAHTPKHLRPEKPEKSRWGLDVLLGRARRGARSGP
jgi:hypothetical protein